MQYLYDETGRRYLDAFAGIVTVSIGHCHPAMVEAVNKQNALLQHTTTIYLNEQTSLYAAELAAKMPVRRRTLHGHITRVPGTSTAYGYPGGCMTRYLILVHVNL